MSKRLMDIIGSLCALIVLAPLLAAVSIVIKTLDSGPVLFRQKRLGQNGKVFTLYKFRTMVVNAEQMLEEDELLHREYRNNGYSIPLRRDPRVTRLGKLLRSCSIDELPQMINVLRGEMSLVGPRPIVPEEVAHYGNRAAEFLSVKPGVTGIWQATGRGNVSYPERAEMELSYIQSRSLKKDILVLLRTAASVMGRRGAD